MIYIALTGWRHRKIVVDLALIGTRLAVMDSGTGWSWPCTGFAVLRALLDKGSATLDFHHVLVLRADAIF